MKKPRFDVEVGPGDWIHIRVGKTGRGAQVKVEADGSLTIYEYKTVHKGGENEEAGLREVEDQAGASRAL